MNTSTTHPAPQLALIALSPSDAALAQAFNEYLDINTGSKSAGTVMTEIWDRAKQLTAETVVTGVSDAVLLRALCEDVPDMHPSVRTQLQALASKIDSGAKIGVTRCRRCGERAEVTVHEVSIATQSRPEAELPESPPTRAGF